MLEAIREVGDQAFRNVYNLALERESLRRQGEGASSAGGPGAGGAGRVLGERPFGKLCGTRYS